MTTKSSTPSPVPKAVSPVAIEAVRQEQEKIDKSPYRRVARVVWITVSCVSISCFMMALYRHNPDLMCLFAAFALVWNIWVFKQQEQNDHGGRKP